MLEPIVLSHWSTLIADLGALSSKQFYSDLADAITKQQMPDVRVSRVFHSQSGIFSTRREYLRVQRDEFVFDICAAPFGSSFFVSSWLYVSPGCLGLILAIPGIGIILNLFFRRWTFYRCDTMEMFMTAVHASVLQIVDAQIKVSNLPPLEKERRTPELTAFYRNVSGR